MPEEKCSSRSGWHGGVDVAMDHIRVLISPPTHVPDLGQQCVEGINNKWMEMLKPFLRL